jgi:hypothetical protein
MRNPTVGDDVLYCEVDAVPLAAKITALMDDKGPSVVALAIFTPEGQVTPMSAAYSIFLRPGFWSFKE